VVALTSLLLAAPTAIAGDRIGITRILSGLKRPVFVTNAGDHRLFIVEQAGRIRIARQVSGEWRITGTFLDIRQRVLHGFEQGLLGLAFHPGYATNGRFYVSYTNNSGDDEIAEFRRGSRPGKADPSSRRVLLTVDDPYPQHNAGWLAFKGRYLYIAFGDGGSVGDPGNRVQRLDVLLGKILRINPLDPDGRGRKRYGIPSGNPFVGNKGRDEIWSYGLRNPWRDSFDRGTGDLWIADVGQKHWEEVNHLTSDRGRNLGWRLLEGTRRYPSNVPCQSHCMTLPVAVYGHTGGNCAVTGGYVARRSGAALFGRYLFGDYCSGRIWSIPVDFAGGLLPSPTDTGLKISSFGEGWDGAVYVVDHRGSVWILNGTS
jgi:glucose/arabinose dehydrogenase